MPPQLRLPNTAAMMIKGAIAGQASEDRRNAAIMATIPKMAKFQEEKRVTARKEKIEAYDYALNLLASVNGPEDLAIAKKILQAKFPGTEDGINKMLPEYSPRTVKMIKQSLLTETQRMKEEDRKEKLEGFSPGTRIFKGGERLEDVPFKKDFELFQDKEGNQFYIKKGGGIPQGATKVKASPGTQVNINTAELSKTTKTGLEKDVIKGIQNIKSFQETRKAFKPEYLTLFGKGERTVAKLMDKAGVSTEDQKQLIRDRAKWFLRAKNDFIAYRKWATGVAGGEKELKEIATAFPDPVNNSPEEYEANLDALEDTTRRILELNSDILDSGINLDDHFGFDRGRKPEVKATPRVIRYDAKGNRIQ